MKLSITIIAIFFSWQLAAQNVGIGIANPADRLHVHGGAAPTGSIAFSNQASGSALSDAMRVGIQYVAGSSANQFGFISMPNNLPFNIWTGGNKRLIINGTGAVGLGMEPYASAALTVNGAGFFFAKNNIGATLMLADSTNTPSLSGSGLSISRRLYNQNHFFQFVMEGSRPQAYIEANFKNGTANQRTSMLLFDSLGNVGIGNYILDSSLNSRLHLFGTQSIQSGNLRFYGPDENYDRADQEITFSYNQYGDELPGPNFFEPSYNYFIRHNNKRTTGGAFATPAYKQGTLAIGRYQTEVGPSFPFYYEGDRIAIAMSPTNKVGIGRYPSSTDNNHKIFIDGNTHINGTRITIDQPSASGQSVLEFRNQGVYVGGFGWSEASSRYFLYDGPTNTNPLLIKNGRIGIGNREPTTNALEVNGNASKSSAGDWIANSDERLKKDIQPLQGALQKLQKLNGITYQWNDDKTGATRPTGSQMGFTAQNIQSVFPELVSRDAQGFLQTAYGTYDALYVEAIKELLEKINMLEKILAALEK